MIVGPRDAASALVLLPGFMSPPQAYAALVAPVAAAGVLVDVPTLYPRGLGTLLGRHTVEEEAEAATGVVRSHFAAGRRIVLAGHSRGGQAALRAGRSLGDAIAALVLVDPVDGAGRRPSVRTSTAVAAVAPWPALVIGAGIGGPCAPAPVNHDAFAEALPGSGHVVVRGLGHADVLEGRSRALGRRLCGGADDPDPGRALVGELLLAVVESRPPDSVPDPHGLLVIEG